MTSSNGNIFLFTCPLWEEPTGHRYSTGHRWIPLIKLSDAELWRLLWTSPEQTVEQKKRDAGDLGRHRSHYDVIAMTLRLLYDSSNVNKVIDKNMVKCPKWIHAHDDVIKWKHFRVTGPLCGEFTGHRWIPLTKTSDAEVWCFLWITGWVNNHEAGHLRRHRAHHDVTVMTIWQCSPIKTKHNKTASIFHGI